MSDLIDRQAAIDEVWSIHGIDDVLCVDEVVNMLENLPSADPELIKGVWTECEVLDSADYDIPQWQSAKCSNCGKYHTTLYEYKLNLAQYCTNCGAKMNDDNDK